MKVGLKRREENPGYTGEEPFNYFLSVLFPDEQLMILPYNRVVKDLNGLDEADFLAAAGEHFTVEKMDGPYAPVSYTHLGSGHRVRLSGRGHFEYLRRAVSASG